MRTHVHNPGYAPANIKLTLICNCNHNKTRKPDHKTVSSIKKTTHPASARAKTRDFVHNSKNASMFIRLFFIHRLLFLYQALIMLITQVTIPVVNYTLTVILVIDVFNLDLWLFEPSKNIDNLLTFRTLMSTAVDNLCFYYHLYNPR